MCQFIESYVSFKSKNKEHEDSFSKFESLIFSGIATNTLDGVEQLGKLIKMVKG